MSNFNRSPFEWWQKQQNDCHHRCRNVISAAASIQFTILHFSRRFSRIRFNFLADSVLHRSHHHRGCRRSQSLIEKEDKNQQAQTHIECESEKGNNLLESLLCVQC